MFNKTIPVVFSALIIGGCVPTKPSDLKKDSAAHYVFEVEQPLKLVNEKVQARLDQCYVKPVPTLGHKLDVINQQALRQTEIYYRSVGVPGVYLIGVSLTSISPDKTSVRVAYHSPMKNAATAVKRWVQDDYVECYSHTFSDNPQEGLKGFKSFNVNTNDSVKSTFDTVAVGLTQCLDGRDSIGKTAYLVDSIYQKNKNEGYVSVGYHGFSFEYRMKVLIKAISNSATMVTVKYQDEFASHSLPIKEWLNNGSTSCNI